MTFDRNGDAWFTAQNSGYVGKLTTADGKIRLWKMEGGSRPYGIVARLEGPSLVRSVRHEQDRHDRSEVERVPRVPLPNDRTRPRRIAITSDDVIWYGDYTRGYLGRLDPRSGKVDEWALPSGGMSMPYAMTSDDRGRVWLAETGPQPNRLVAFDPAQSKFTETITIPSKGANTIRHMTFDRTTRQIWFGGDANMIGRVQVAPPSIVP